MATNTGKNFRKGAVRDRTHVKNSRTGDFTKRDEDRRSTADGEFMDNKKDEKPFKGVAKEPDRGR